MFVSKKEQQHTLKEKEQKKKEKKNINTVQVKHTRARAVMETR